MNITRKELPHCLSKKGIIILKDLIKEIVNYSNELLNSKFVQEAKKILDIGYPIFFEDFRRNVRTGKQE